jgi:Acetokinase family
VACAGLEGRDCSRLTNNDDEPRGRRPASKPQEDSKKGGMIPRHPKATSQWTTTRWSMSTATSPGIAAAAKDLGFPPPVAAGHRVVHGGPDHTAPERVEAPLLAELRRLVAFAPLHLPSVIQGIEAVTARFPGLPQVACFDTTIHRRMPEVARHLPRGRAVLLLAPQAHRGADDGARRPRHPGLHRRHRRARRPGALGGLSGIGVPGYRPRPTEERGACGRHLRAGERLHGTGDPHQ